MKMNQVRSVVMVYILTIFWIPSFGQDIPENVDPANVTDSQLENAVEKAQQQGYTQQQIESMARARGLSEVEISNLRQRIQNLQTETEGVSLSETQLREEFRKMDL